MFLICCPEKSVKITYRNRNPWINKSLKQDIAERENLLKIKTKDPSEENVSIIKRCRNRVIALQRKAEMEQQGGSLVGWARQDRSSLGVGAIGGAARPGGHAKTGVAWEWVLGIAGGGGTNKMVQ